MHAFRAVVLLTALLLPGKLLASGIVDLTFSTTPDTESIAFGLDPFRWSGPLGAIGPMPGPGIDSGSINLTSGPLLGLTVDPAGGQSVYTYGPGTLHIDAVLGGLHGAFTAPTGVFSIHVCEGCDSLFGGSLADDFIVPLGTGRFNKTLARILGVVPDTAGGLADFGLEAITGDPTSRVRQAFDHRGFVSVLISAAIPEPSMLALGLSAVAYGIFARHRRHRRVR